MRSNLCDSNIFNIFREIADTAGANWQTFAQVQTRDCASLMNTDGHNASWLKD